ncbi:hypothetical protein CLOP_g24935 [Closterium sp. NIES-67]|nr:hypothetical protein CLOP_g24935 [Closterium sp. NIES-67]
MLFEHLTVSKAGVWSFPGLLAEGEVVRSPCDGEATTCDATSAANLVISLASVACVSEGEEVERAVAALRVIAEALITVARGTPHLVAGARLPAAEAPPRAVVAGAPPPPPEPFPGQAPRKPISPARPQPARRVPAP